MKAILLHSREIAPEVRHFVFEVPEVETISFLPGQFVSFQAELAEKSVIRVYSIASPPNGNRFELCLNRVEDGLFSPHLFDLKPGDVVEMRGVYGTFVFRKPVSDSVLVATGTGIAPFRAMLQAQLPYDSVHEFTLLFGVRYEQGLLYHGEFESMAQRHSNFRFCPTLTRPGPDWTGLVGRVQPHLVEIVGARRDLDVYICGLKAMVDSVRALLKQLGFERKRIIYEKYD